MPTAVLLLLQAPVPPDAARSFSGVVKPVHTVVTPVIGPTTGEALTVIFTVVVSEPQLTLVSVKIIVTTPALTP